MHTITPARPTPTPGSRPFDAPAWNRQRHSPMPSHRYRDVAERVALPGGPREWPARRLTAAPLWVPVDLRDGNQALAEPMDPSRKRRFFELLVRMGYTEIEVGYPSASQTDFDFVRLIAETDIAPDDVTIVVFTPARRDLIERTIDAIRGIRNEVVVHMYTATAPTWRDVVLGHDRNELATMILDGGRDVLASVGGLPNVRFQFSPEVFNLTEPDYVLEVCDRMTSLWDASPDRPVTLNLPATVEVATPNVYADQIEYMHRNLAHRAGVILSVHPHNDRGTGIACAELALLAGAERVEGCVFGNGERTGNVDLATLALNLHAQGIDPMIDFSDIDEVRRTVEYCTRLEIHPRHPYVGDLVHTAFSGTHQDAIRKGLAEHRDRARTEGRPESHIEWRVPYLPIDPADIGRGYEAVVRVNSQSGKGGISYLLESEYGVELPRRLQIDFAGRVQQDTDESGREFTAAQLWHLFRATYIDAPPARAGDWLRLLDHDATDERTVITLGTGEVTSRSVHEGCDPVQALLAALAEQGIGITVDGLHTCSVGDAGGGGALVLVEFRRGGAAGWAGGTDRSVMGATLRAIVRAATCPGSTDR